MHIKVYLKNMETGEAGVYCPKLAYQDWDNEGGMPGWKVDVLSQWGEDGNYGCDCNRSLFLYQNDESLEMLCSDGRIVVEKIVCVETGETFRVDS